MQLNEKGYYFTVLMFGLFAVGFAIILSVILPVIGLWNATILPSEKGFYAFSFLLAIFGAVTVQKNTRDALEAEKDEKKNP